MLNKGENIEDLFGKAFRDSEITPPNNLWADLESTLNKNSVEDIYKQTFQNATVKPSSKVWRKIATVLFFKSFFQFNPKSFNVYYVALSTIVGIVGFSFLPNNNKNVNPIITVNKSSEKSIVNQSDNKINEVSQVQNSSIENHNHSQKSIENSNQTSNQNSIQPENQKQLVGVSQKSKANKDESKKQAAAFDFSKIQIKGKSKICVLSDAEYIIDGMPMESEIEWNLSQKLGVVKFVSTRKIVASWNKAGNYIVSATIKVGNSKKVFEYPVIVEVFETPTIKGKTKVCEGQEKQLYTVEEPVDKKITYLWTTKRNKIDFIGNKYIEIDWNKSGKDTLFVTKFNSESGCKTQAVVAIQVSPKPEVDFEMTPLNANEFEFKYVGNSKKVTDFVWKIQGSEYNDNVIVHENNGLSSAMVVLEVKDKNKCKNTIHKEVTFNKNILFVSKTIDLNESNGFIPQTNTRLKSYKIEIYNASNVKIWESIELKNGKPSQEWDGIYKGQKLPSGKYFWRIVATFEDGVQWKGVLQPNGSYKPSGIVIVE